MKIIGYTDPLSLAGGERIRLMVSTGSPSFHVSLHRLAGSGGPEIIPSEIDGDYRGVRQVLRAGSHILVDDPPPLEPGAGFTLEAWVWPTVPGTRVAAIVGRHDGSHGYLLGVDALGRATLWLDGQATAAPEPLRSRTWYHLRATFDAAGRSTHVSADPLRTWPRSVERTEARQRSDGWSRSDAPFRIAASGEESGAHYNGKIEAPRLLDAAGAVLASWDFGGQFASDLVTDTSGGARHGRCVNLPMRAVTGHGWTGRATNPSLAPDEYAAIWFHDDDLDDARWAPSIELRVPDDLSSGVYAFRLAAEGEVDEVPFFIRPPHGSTSADVAVLLPTLSYLAYGNEHNSWTSPIPSTPGLDRILAAVGPADRYAAENRLKSIYERHTDDSGVAYSSRLRPIVNMRADYRMPLLIGGPHQFSADMELLTWLDGREIDYDVITDEDLHHEGEAVLRDYRVMLTGSHPEYWTSAMLDALESWLADGGRLMYLGGNGFYWVTSLFPDRPHVLEVRRGHAGTGVWRSEPGEVHHASTGEPGGLWRFRGRPPQRVAGIGFTAQGFDESRPYRVEEGGRDQRAAWILDGVESTEVGAYGSVLNGAGGFEIDRVDDELGTPPHALVVARCDGFTDAYQATTEDILTPDSKQGGTVSPLVRADMVFFEGPNDGAVFSTGSIAWCGALLDDNSDNGVSRITENVLRRFLRQGPIT